MEKVRYLRRRSYGFEYEPNKAMKRAGFCFEALGKDEAEAVRRAKEINDEWDDYRKNERPFIANVEKGDINWLIDKFQRDQTWYLSKARPTRDEYDLSFKIIGALYGPIKVKFLEVRKSVV